MDGYLFKKHQMDRKGIDLWIQRTLNIMKMGQDFASTTAATTCHTCQFKFHALNKKRDRNCSKICNNFFFDLQIKQ